MMASRFFPSAALALAIAGSLIQANALAQAAPAASTAPVGTATASLLGGKLRFALPADFTAAAVQDGNAEDGTEGAKARTYENHAQQQMILVADQGPMPDGIRVEDNDPKFLDGIMASFVAQQQASWQDYQRLGEKSLSIKGLGLRQLDATASFSGRPIRVTMLLAGSGNTLALVRISSNADDAAKHKRLVASVLDGIKVGP